MPVDIVMPRLSDSMEEGTILAWLKAEDDRVKRGEDLVEIETDKANMTYQSDTAGTLVEILAKEGDTLPVGTPIARIDTGAAAEKPAKRGEAAESTKPAPPEPVSPEPAPPEPQAPAPPTAAPVSGGRIKASPVARKLAADLGVDIAALSGSGPGGRIVKTDVEAVAGARPRAAAVPAQAPPPLSAPVGEPTAKGSVEVVELTRPQRTVARRMAESKATAPHFYLQMEIDMTEATHLREQLKSMTDEPAPTYNDMVVKATALALREHPRANGAYRDGKVELYSRVNVGVAVAANEALVVPTVADADTKSLGEIARETRALAERVREGTITPPELSGGTFTVSNLGMYGIDNFQAVINPPQAGLLSIGAIKKKPAVDPGTDQIVARSIMGVTLACDHRILYGADGAQFLARIRELLEEPLALTL